MVYIYGLSVDESADNPYISLVDNGLSFEWDEAKAQSNLAKHGVPFDVAVEAFFADDLIVVEGKEGHGEPRFSALATVEGFALAVVYTVRGDAVRIISARRQSKRERSL